MNRELVKAAADLLERKGAWAHLPPIPDETFTMTLFENSCRTRHCAAGHIALDEYFTSRGFAFDYIFVHGSKARTLVYEKYGRRHTSYDAISEFFEMSLHDVFHFFSPENRVENAAEVGSQLRETLAYSWVPLGNPFVKNGAKS